MKYDKIDLQTKQEKNSKKLEREIATELQRQFPDVFSQGLEAKIPVRLHKNQNRVEPITDSEYGRMILFIKDVYPAVTNSNLNSYFPILSFESYKKYMDNVDKTGDLTKEYEDFRAEVGKFYTNNAPSKVFGDKYVNMDGDAGIKAGNAYVKLGTHHLKAVIPLRENLIFYSGSRSRPAYYTLLDTGHKALTYEQVASICGLFVKEFKKHMSEYNTYLFHTDFIDTYDTVMEANKICEQTYTKAKEFADWYNRE